MVTINAAADDTIVYLTRSGRPLAAHELPSDREIDAAAEALWLIQTGHSARIAGQRRTWNTEPGILRAGLRYRAKMMLIAARAVSA